MREDRPGKRSTFSTLRATFRDGSHGPTVRTPSVGAHSQRSATTQTGSADLLSATTTSTTTTTSTPTAPFTECPAVGADSSCGLLIEITDSGAVVYGDPSQGPYDSVEDTLIGVINDSTKTMGALALTSSTDLFGFDGDGLCIYIACGWAAPTTYEGPNTSFSDVSADYSSGVVNFPAGLAPGGSTYFSLEEALSTSNVTTGSGQSAVTALEVGQAANLRELLQLCSTPKPVNCATGVFWHSFDDLAIPGRGPAVDLQRTYSSLLSSTDSPFGYGWSSPFTMSLSIAGNGDVTVHQENGSTIGFTASGSSFVAPTRVLATLVKNADGSYTLTDARGGMAHTFSAAGRLLSVRDRNGETTTLSYAGGVLSGVTDAAGRTLIVTTNAGGHITRVADPTGRALVYGYDASGNLTAVTDVRGGTWGFTYDGSHRMLTMTDPRAGRVTNTYDTSGRVTTQQDQMGRTTTFAFSGDPTSTAGGTTTITDPRGKVTLENYQQLQLQSITHGSGSPDAATTTFSYDPFTLGLASRTDANGHTSTYSYDRRGNLLTSTDPLGRTATMSWNGLNEPTSSTDPAGHATTYGYDATGNLVSVARALSSTVTQATQFQHATTAHPGDVTGIVDADGNAWSYAYDAAGDLTAVTDPVGNTTHAGYDPAGRRISSTTGRGNTTTYVYDPANELTKITDPAGGVTQFAYDADGDRTSSTDADGHQTTTTFDADAEPVTVTRANGSTLTYGYDAAGNQTSQTNGAGKTTGYGYDALNRVTTVSDPLNRVTSYTYDGVGNRTKTTNPSGATISYGYDAANELTSTNYSDPQTPDVTYAYTTNGLRRQMTDGTGTSTYSYDNLDRLTATTNGAGQTVGYGYDLANRLTSLTYPNNQTVTRGYDSAGRLTSVTDWKNHTSTFGYNADGDANTETLANGVTQATTRDLNDQVTGIADTGAGTTLASFAYTRDANTQLTGTTTTGSSLSDPNHTYGYTSLNQLNNADTGTYAFDAADNLTRLASGATMTYDAADEATSYTSPAGVSTSLTYDGIGDRLTGLAPGGGTMPYAYDQAGRLTSAGAAKQRLAVLAAGNAHTLAVTAAGTVASWGLNKNGQLGDGTTTTRLAPVAVPNLTGATAVAAGGNFSLASVGGTVKAWGDNRYGQLGNYSTTGSSTPRTPVYRHWDGDIIGGTKTYISDPISSSVLAAGDNHALAIDSGPAGTIWSWGLNAAGQLGDGNTTNANTAQIVTGINHGVAVAAGGNHSLAVDSSGTVYSWGEGSYGALGNGTTTNATNPVTVAGVQASDVAAGTNHSLALASDGTIWAWGRNNSGQLGDGTTSDSSRPVHLSGLSNVIAIAAGDNSSYALTSSGTLYAWGLNANGQLGDGTTTNRTAPTVVGAIAGGSAIAAGTGHALASITSGAVKSWGLNTNGQLGIGTTANSPSPVTVTGLTAGSASGASSATYSYSGGGERASRTAAGATQHFAWDDHSSMPALLTDGSTSYLYDDAGMPVEQIDAAGTTLYYSHDQYGSTRLLTNQAGAVSATFTYDPYGSTTSHTGAADTPLRWNGQYQDPDTGLYYLRARYYDPTVGGFLTRDPLAAMTQAPYGYAGNNPLNGADPLGLCWPSWACGAENAVGSAVSGTANWIGDHPAETVGIVLGVAAAATGVGAVIEGATALGTVLAGTSVLAGTAAAGLDGHACIVDHETAACVGATLGAVSAIAGLPAAIGAAGVTFGLIEEESLADALLNYLPAGFAFNFGVAGVTFDAVSLLIQKECAAGGTN